MTPKEQTPDAQPSESAHSFTEGHEFIQDKTKIVNGPLGPTYGTKLVPASESSHSPTDTQNYICLNCKLVLNHEPKQCPECKHQFFHKTDASPTEQPGDSANNYKCADCGTDINEGEFKTFGICDDCWDKHHAKAKVQPSHSTTEQHADAKHTPGPDLMQGWEIRPNFLGYKTTVYKRTGAHETTLIASCFNEQIAELIARAPALLSEVSTLRSKQAELVAENGRLKDKLKDYCNDCQHPTVNESQATELSKLRQENAEYAVAQKGNLARLDQLNALVKSIWEVLEIPSPLIFKETANNIPLLDFIKGLKQENNDLRKLTDEQFPE